MKRIISILVIAAILYSCSTTHKSKSYSKSTVDSSSVVKIDSNVVKKIDSVSVKKDNTVTTVEKEDDYTKETVIEFDSTTRSSTPAADYFPAIRKITIKEKGIKKEKQIIAANTIDSSQVTKNETLDLTKTVNTDVKKTEVVKNKVVKRTSYWGWLWFLLIPVVWLAGWWLGLWPLIPKRKKKDDYPVKYNNYNPPKPPTVWHFNNKL